MKIIFMGTPDFAVPTLDALIAAGHDVACVYSQPPRPAHRGKRETNTPVHIRADALGLMVRTPTSLRGTDAQAEFAALNADVAVVAAYGLILPQAILGAPLHGCLNVHGSLLPRWRGAAPAQRAILAGDTETGVGIMQMAAGLDTGPVRLTGQTPIARKTAGELTDELAEMGATLMVRVLADMAGHPPTEQPSEGVTYASKITKDEARIDWNLSAVQVERMVRAFAPIPGAWFDLGGERVKVLSAEVLPPSIHPLLPSRHPREGGDQSPKDASSTGPEIDSRLRGNDDNFYAASPGTIIDDVLTIACNPGMVRPTLIQRAGRGAMTASDFLRGHAVPAGTRLS